MAWFVGTLALCTGYLHYHPPKRAAILLQNAKTWGRSMHLCTPHTVVFNFWALKPEIQFGVTSELLWKFLGVPWEFFLGALGLECLKSCWDFILNLFFLWFSIRILFRLQQLYIEYLVWFYTSSCTRAQLWCCVSQLAIVIFRYVSCINTVCLYFGFRALQNTICIF